MYPAHGQLRVVACKIELAKGAKDPKALAVCDRAAELVADTPSAVALATVRAEAGDAAGARTAIVAAEARLAKLSPDQSSAGWLALAAYYKQASAVTWAEDAALKAGGDDATKTWAAMTRARYGVPRSKVKPEDDAAVVTAVRGVIDLVNAGKFDAAARAAATAEKRWPGLPGLYAARCNLEVNRHAYAAAKPLCAQAIAQGSSSWGAYLSGILELQDQSDAATARGIADLRAAVALDPDLGQAWRALGKALGRAKATADLEQLRRDYATRFGQPMP
jgi:hypothetical protein